MHKILFGITTAWALSATACYNPSLGDEPFLCAATGKECPDDYQCQAKAKIRICVPAGVNLDAGAPDTTITDAQLLPSKEGPVFLDGALVENRPGCVDDETGKPNNTSDTATALVGTGKISDWDICYPGDVDHYSIEVKTGKKLSIRVEFDHSKGDLDAALLGDLERRDHVAERLRHLAPVAVESKSVSDHTAVGSLIAVVDRHQQGGLKPAAVLVVALEIQVGRPRQLVLPPEYGGVGDPGLEPDVEDVAAARE